VKAGLKQRFSKIEQNPLRTLTLKAKHKYFAEDWCRCLLLELRVCSEQTVFTTWESADNCKSIQ